MLLPRNPKCHHEPHTRGRPIAPGCTPESWARSGSMGLLSSWPFVKGYIIGQEESSEFDTVLSPHPSRK